MVRKEVLSAGYRPSSRTDYLISLISRFNNLPLRSRFDVPFRAEIRLHLQKVSLENITSRDKRWSGLPRVGLMYRGELIKQMRGTGVWHLLPIM